MANSPGSETEQGILKYPSDETCGQVDIGSISKRRMVINNTNLGLVRRWMC